MERVDYIPVRHLTEFVYCPRLGYLELACCEYDDNYFTLDGALKHRRVDVPSSAATGIQNETEEVIHSRSVILSSERLGIIGKIDIVEGYEGRFQPVEYKRGKIPKPSGKVYDSSAVQLCAYGLLLLENGYHCDSGVIYYVDSKKRVKIPFDSNLIELTISKISEFRALAEGGKIPPPLENSNKCVGCSLVGICLPDETHAYATSDSLDKAQSRRLVPARDDRVPVYVNEQGAYISKSGEVLIFVTREKDKRKEIAQARLIDVSQVCLFGNVQASTQVIRELCARGIPICYFSYGGWFYGITHGHSHKNVLARLAQYRWYSDEKLSLSLAGEFVAGKIKNTRTFLRRNHPGNPEGILTELKRLSQSARAAMNMQQLLGIEGLASRAYFSVFSEMLKGLGKSFDFRYRNRRPPKDPVNALLSYAYALLVKDLTVTVYSVGLDPYLGIYHQVKYGKPSLALDLAEEFRPLVAESVVLTLINNGEVRESDFIRKVGSVAMKEAARRKLIEAYERRMNTLIKHPIFGYTISYRRIMEVQARLLSRVFMGEIPMYIPFTTR